jgi:hypothetical protein
MITVFAFLVTAYIIGYWLWVGWHALHGRVEIVRRKPRLVEVVRKT